MPLPRQEDLSSHGFSCKTLKNLGSRVLIGATEITGELTRTLIATTIRSPRDADRRQARRQLRVRIPQPLRLPQQSVCHHAIDPLKILRQWFDVRPLVGEAEAFEQQPSNRRDG